MRQRKFRPAMMACFFRNSARAGGSDSPSPALEQRPDGSPIPGELRLPGHDSGRCRFYASGPQQGCKRRRRRRTNEDDSPDAVDVSSSAPSLLNLFCSRRQRRPASSVYNHGGRGATSIHLAPSRNLDAVCAFSESHHDREERRVVSCACRQHGIDPTCRQGVEDDHDRVDCRVLPPDARFRHAATRGAHPTKTETAAAVTGGGTKTRSTEPVEHDDQHQAVANCTSLTSLSIAASPRTAEEELLIAELGDYVFQRGVLADHASALKAARLCVALLSTSRDCATGLEVLVDLARVHLDLSAAASTCLLARMNWHEISTVGALAETNCVIFNARCLPGEDTGACAHARLQNTQEIRHSPSAPVEPEAVAAAAEACVLVEACRAWAETMKVVRSTTSHIHGFTPCSIRERGRESCHTLSDLEGERSQDVLRCDCPPTLPLPPPPLTRTAKVDGSSFEQQARAPQTSLTMRQAVHVMAAGATSCYGQLVVLGYKEFTVRDSTWHRVGPKNERFVLARRDNPNGVRITERGVHVGDCGGGDGAVRRDRTHRRKRGSVNGSMSARRACDSKNRRRSFSSSSHEQETWNVDTSNHSNGDSDDSDGGCDADVMLRVSGTNTAYETPNTRSNHWRARRGGEAPARRARGIGSGGSIAGVHSGGHATGIVSSGWAGALSARGRGSGGSKLSATVKSMAAAALSTGPSVVAREEDPYRILLSPSVLQREMAQVVTAKISERQARSCAAAITAMAVRRQGLVDVWCSLDTTCDMYQVGRMQGAGNDFTVRGPLHESSSGAKVCGPVSRYAVRLMVDRAPPYRCRIYTGGFNARKCLTLPTSSPKWVTETGEWDAVTTFGVRILKPEIGEWREVTVAGAIRQPRVGRLDTVGDLVPGETNEITSGTIIDVGGVQMLYESAESMARAGGICPSNVISNLNGLQPQCPVQLQTLTFKPWTPQSRHSGPLSRQHSHPPRGADADADSHGGIDSPAPDVDDERENGDEAALDKVNQGLVPHIFPACGHIHGYAPQLAHGPCPMCRTPGSLVEILFGWCTAIDREMPTVVFNPCGHVASIEVAERWASLTMPNNAPPEAVYRPICPYCAKPLASKNGERPFSKMIFSQ